VRLVGSGWDAFLAAEREHRSEASLSRSARPFLRDGVWLVTDDGRRLLDLSSNDYLGLAASPMVREAVAEGARTGAGATSSRLVVGSDPGVRALEEELAAFQGTEAAVALGSGYLANVGVIPAVVGAGDAVVCDRLDHASTWDGVKVSGARLYRYRHCDVDALAKALRRAERDGARRTLIVTESVFSMDGDLAPLVEIAELKQRHGAALLVDEAHADGVFGPGGRGLAHELGVAAEVDLHLGTFGKAFGCYGAYVAGSAAWIEHLVNTTRSFIFSTGLPPGVVAGVRAALRIVEGGGDLRAALGAKAERFRGRLRAEGFAIGESASQIVPLLVGDSADALALSAALEARGVLGVAIRPPTVPRDSARLRFSVTAAHGDGDLDRALDVIAELAAPVCVRAD
jgi:8-amino-7-oxononanoate synthase